jgi:hypothetical protein
MMTLAREPRRGAPADLRGLIAEALRQRASFQNRNAAGAQKPVMIVEQAINNFVHLLLRPAAIRQAPGGSLRTCRIFDRDRLRAGCRSLAPRRHPMVQPNSTG